MGIVFILLVNNKKIIIKIINDGITKYGNQIILQDL